MILTPPPHQRGRRSVGKATKSKAIGDTDSTVLRRQPGMDSGKAGEIAKDAVYDEFA